MGIKKSGSFRLTFHTVGHGVAVFQWSWPAAVARIVDTLEDQLEDVLLDAMHVDGDLVSRED